MRAVDLIRRKRDGGALAAGDIRAFVAGAAGSGWPDYQIAAMLMAITIRGMTLDEAAELTAAMAESGARLDLSAFGDAVVDKHSTGGVGDKISLVAAPLAAACGARVPMVSGRGLGHTGGTLDKLEAIPGFRTRLSLDEARRTLASTGCVLIGQTDDLAPADRRLYALRDVTGTVESVPLMAASILSKKIAAGIRALVLDVKVGLGAFMKTPEEARALAGWIVAIAARQGLRVEAVLTAMDAPLGHAVGNANEVAEAVAVLEGKGPEDVETLSTEIAARMVRLAGRADTATTAHQAVRAALSSGEGLRKFRDVVAAQGGDPGVIDDPARLPQPSVRHPWPAPRSGIVTAIDAARIGVVALVLGAGRDRVDATVDPAAGVNVRCRVGAAVRAGEPVLELVTSDAARLPAALDALDEAVAIGDWQPAPLPLIQDVVTAPAAVAHG
jgi:pyrimidine-nucleoside phosphorylase